MHVGWIPVGVPERSAAPCVCSNPQSEEIKLESQTSRSWAVAACPTLMKNGEEGRERGVKTPSLHFPGDFLVQSQQPSVRRGAADGPGLQGELG